MVKSKRSFGTLVAAGFVAVGLLFTPQAAQAATAGISQPTLNNCQYVTVPPRLSGVACWNVFGGFAKLPAGCYPTRVWKCYQV
jgi:hypothetical protein